MEFATSWLFLFLMLGSGGGVGLPLGVPPLPEDPLLAKIAPEECLLYMSSAGMAKPDTKSANHTERLFAEPEVRHLAVEVERLIRTSLKDSTKGQKPEARALAEAAPGLVKVFLTRPFAVYVTDVKAAAKGPPRARAGLVVSLGDEADKMRAGLKALLATLPAKAKEVTIEGTTFHRLTIPGDGPDITWGIKDGTLYAAAGEEEIEALLKRTQGSAPKWLGTLHKNMPVERVSTVGMVNVRGWIELLPSLGVPEKTAGVLEALGLTGIDRLEGVSGLGKDGFVSRSLVSLRGEPKGLLSLAQQKPLTTADLDLIPRDATFALAFRLDPARARTAILELVEKIDPRAKEALQANDSQREMIEQVTNALGDSWCLFDSPSEGGLLTGLTAVVSVKDADAAAALERKLVALLPAADDRHRPRIESFTFAGKTVHVFDSRSKGFPLAPSWCLTDKHLIVAAYPGAIKAFLMRGKTFQSVARIPEVAQALEGEGQLVALTYTDTRRVFDLAYPLLPVFFQMLGSEMRGEGIDVPPGLLPSAGSIRRHLRPSVSTLLRTPAGIESVSRQTLPGGTGLSTMPVTLGLLIPAVQKVREAAARTQSANNLKQLALASHNYLDTNKTFPPAYSANKDGKPLLSWRVHILPYIEQEALYKEFHLDEPWDSEHNKKLIERMPKTYRSPASNAPPEMTTYLTVRGKDTMFPGAKGIGVADVTDGLSNTIMIVEASDKKAVIWTKPDDFEFNDKNPIDGLLGFWSAGFQAAMGDGSVRMIGGTIDPKVLKDLFLRNDGHALPPGF